MLTEIQEQVYDSLLIEWDGLSSENYQVRPEIMSIIKSYFPEGNMVFDLGQAYQKIYLCIGEIQFYVEGILTDSKPEDISETVTSFVVQILGIERAWQFMVKHGLVITEEDNLDWV